MRLGTPGFVGSRLREAREARGLTAVSLADLVGVSRQAVSQFETDAATPSPDTLYRMASVLKVPVTFFQAHAREQRAMTIFYRSMAATVRPARLRAEKRLLWLEDITDVLREFVEFPPVQFPRLERAKSPLQLSNEDIEQAAAALRRHWNLGDLPISNVVWLAENQGAMVARLSLDAHELDALSTRAEHNRPYILLSDDKASAARSRFDLAHEIGHMVLHHALDARALTSSPEFRLIEDQAHYFAGAFLLPEASFGRDAVALTLDGLSTLKAKWRVSIGAMIMRAKNLDLISGEFAQRLLMLRSRRGWQRNEPLDDTLPVEEPRILKRAIELIVSEQVLSRPEMVERLGLTVTDIEELAGLVPGYLSDDHVPVRLIDRLTVRGPAAGSESSGEGRILGFTDRQEPR